MSSSSASPAKEGDPSYVSKTDLIDWVNNLLQLQLTKLEQVCEQQQVWRVRCCRARSVVVQQLRGTPAAADSMPRCRQDVLRLWAPVGPACEWFKGWVKRCCATPH